MKKILTILSLLLVLTTSAQSRHRYKSYSYKDKTFGLGLFIGGAAFTAASILETNSHYLVYQYNPSNPSIPIATYPPFWQQTPRQIVFVVGVTFTITGLFTMIANK